ncbi:MAG TPA: DUF1156 domain-containing protein [Gemmataceae bacterium]
MTPEAATLAHPHTPAASQGKMPVREEVVMDGNRVRLLIEDWLPIKEISIESLRERTPMTPFPAPNRLHVWWARRPLVASRAAVLAGVLASVIRSSADPTIQERIKQIFKHILGIHGNPIDAKKRIAEATRQGIRLGKDAYGYGRAFQYTPTSEELDWIRKHADLAGYGTKIVVADLMSGGGSIPFEILRLGMDAVANDLNPVAWLVLKATIELPGKHGLPLLKRYRELGHDFVRRLRSKLSPFYPPEPEPNCIPDGYLWARTIRCPYCGGIVPLLPNWKLDSKGKGVRLVPHIDSTEHRYCTFEIMEKVKDQRPGTIKGGDATCPFADCGRFIDGDEIKAQARAGRMGHQLFAIGFKRQTVTGYTKAGKPKIKSVRDFRSPSCEDEIEMRVREELDAKLTEWQAADIIPQEARYLGPADRCANYGITKHIDLFSPRQLLCHCTSVEVFRDLMDELSEPFQEITELDRAAMIYLAIAIDKVANYNSISTIWDATRVSIRQTFSRHDFSFKKPRQNNLSNFGD